MLKLGAQPLRTTRPTIGKGALSLSRSSLVCRAEATETKAVDVKAPEWLPEQAVPALKFLNASDFNVAESSLYKTYLQSYVENDLVQKSIGFKALAEILNGRAAMLGFVAAATGEILGGGPILKQMSAISPIVLAILGALTAATVIPVVKDFKGSDALLKEYSLPQQVFTESIERVHGRLAMLGFGVLLSVELILGRALL